MTDNIERAILRDEFALGVFLDIEGGFDNLLPEAVVRELERRNLSEEETWIRNYLVNRTFKTDHKGIVCECQVGKGTPQGGVISPILWNLAFDELLRALADVFTQSCICR